MKQTDKKKLTSQQLIFVELYCSGMSQIQAYREAGYKGKAESLAWRMMENDGIRQAIKEYEDREKEKIQKRLDRLIVKSVDNIESAMSLDEDDPSLNFFKMMAIQHKTKTAENHLKRMGFDSAKKFEHSGSLELSWKDIIYGTTEVNEDNETRSD